MIDVAAMVFLFGGLGVLIWLALRSSARESGAAMRSRWADFLDSDQGRG